MRITTIAVLAAASLWSGSAGAQPTDWSHAQPISVELSSFKFTPSSFTLERGVPYRLHLTNSASGGHDFAAKELFAASTIAPEDAVAIKDGEIGLKSGQSADILLIANRAGSYPFRCTHFMHSTFGMTGTVTVR